MEPALVLLVSADGNSFDWQPQKGVNLPPFTLCAALTALQAIAMRQLAGATEAKPIIMPGTDGMAAALKSQHPNGRRS